MTKIGNTSVVKGVEAALCVDLNSETARVVDREKNGIISSLAMDEVRLYACRVIYIVTSVQSFSVDYLGLCRRPINNLGSIHYEVSSTAVHSTSCIDELNRLS